MEYFFGVPNTPVVNVSPAWAVDTPATLNFPSGGGTYNFAAKVIDPQPWDTMYFTLLGTIPLGYSLNSSSGILTVLNGSPDATVTIRVSDNEFAFADHVVSVTVESSVVIEPPPIVGSTDTNYVYTGIWRVSEDIVAGWDWTIPPSVSPAPLCGVFTNGNTDPLSVYPGWQGNKIKVLNAKWKDLEASRGNYAGVTALKSQVEDLSGGWDGVFMQLRGWVVNTPVNPGAEITAPNAWLQSYFTSQGWGTVPTMTLSGIQSLLATDSHVKTLMLALISACGSRGLYSSGRIWQQILHMPSGSRGEEYAIQNAGSNAASIEYIAAWATAMGADKERLMWTDDRGFPDIKAVFDSSVQTGPGIGARGGAIESWLNNWYTPGYKKYCGQIMDANGYLSVDETHICIANDRGWHDQNEYAASYTPANAADQQNYRMAHLRSMQMRRRIVWVRDGYIMNPRMDNWIAMDAGHHAADAWQAWICLMQTWAKSSNDGSGYAEREVNNFEKWLYQRESGGATSPNLNKDHGKNVSSNDTLPTTKWNISLARNGTSIGIAIDAAFIPTGTNRSVCIKVSFCDTFTTTWTLQYTRSNGTTGTKSVTGTGTNRVRTATFFLTDFRKPAAGFTPDFFLKSSNASVPFMFVRVIKV